jgi:hypothetical protein
MQNVAAKVNDMHIHFVGMPHSGHRALHDFFVKHALAASVVADLDALSQHVLVAEGDALVLVLHCPRLCAWMQVLGALPAADRAQQVRAFHTTLAHPDFDPKAYAHAVRRALSACVPVKPNGGIFFTRTPHKRLVVCLEWDRLAHNLPIVEFVLGVKLDRWLFGTMRHHKAQEERAARESLDILA